MAEMTLPVGAVTDSSGTARLEVDVDDTSDPTDWSLIRFRCINGMGRTVFVDTVRGNGVSFWTTEIPAGQTVTKNAGGPVKRESDLARVSLRTT